MQKPPDTYRRQAPNAKRTLFFDLGFALKLARCSLMVLNIQLTNMIWSPRGSEWHRWDPHLHAPGTLLSDQFGGDWEAYLRAIETATPAIHALGVTDYFCIGTYREVRRYKELGRLPRVECLFPNVELRLDIKTGKSKPINIHLLFSPEDPNHEQHIERILGQLKFEFREQMYFCTRTQLIELGRAFDPKQTDELGALRTGATQFKTSLH